MALEGYETSAQAAERYGIDQSQVRRYCEAGRIPGAVKVANRWFIPADAWPEAAGFGRPPSWKSSKNSRKTPHNP